MSLHVSSPAQQTGLANQASSEDYRNGPVDFYNSQGSLWLKSVGEVLIMPKAIRVVCLTPLVLPTLWEAPGLGAPAMCSMANRDAYKHQCLFPHLHIVVSLKGKQFARRPNLLCVPEVSKFGQWLDHFVPGTAGHSSCFVGLNVPSC